MNKTSLGPFLYTIVSGLVLSLSSVLWITNADFQNGLAEKLLDFSLNHENTLLFLMPRLIDIRTRLLLAGFSDMWHVALAAHFLILFILLVTLAVLCVLSFRYAQCGFEKKDKAIILVFINGRSLLNNTQDRSLGRLTKFLFFSSIVCFAIVFFGNGSSKLPSQTGLVKSILDTTILSFGALAILLLRKLLLLVQAVAGKQDHLDMEGRKNES